MNTFAYHNSHYRSGLAEQRGFSLPLLYDVWTQVFNHIHLDATRSTRPQVYRQTLKSCCLVNRDMLGIAQPLLFRKYALVLHDRGEAAMGTFLAIAHHPRLKDTIHHLSIVVGQYALCAMPYISLRSSLASLQVVEMSMLHPWSGLHQQFKRFFQDLCSHQSLQVLEISTSPRMPVGVLQYFTNIRKLTLGQLNLRSHTTAHPLPHPHLPLLEELSVRAWDVNVIHIIEAVWLAAPNIKRLDFLAQDKRTLGAAIDCITIFCHWHRLPALLEKVQVSLEASTHLRPPNVDRLGLWPRLDTALSQLKMREKPHRKVSLRMTIHLSCRPQDVRPGFQLNPYAWLPQLHRIAREGLTIVHPQHLERSGLFVMTLS